MLKRKHNSGFTLIEALIVIFIISLLVALILLNYQTIRQKHMLSQVNQKLISDIRKVQNMAINGVEVPGYCSEGLTCSGYGVYITSGSSYIFFADINGDQTYNSGEGFETVDLSSLISIDSTSPSNLNIFFESPDPVTYINQNNNPGVSGEITLKVVGKSFSKQIRVTTSGLIDNF